MSQPRVRVAVVFGGRSSEHAVSCSTAASVLRAIDRTAYDVVPIGIATDGRWVLMPDDPAPLELRPGQRPEVSGEGPGVLVPTSTTDRSLTVLQPGQVPRSLGDVDVVFPVAARALLARTARSRVCSSWLTCPMSGPGSWRRPQRWTSSS